MKIIAHRGNIHGPNDKFENHPDYIQKALNDGFDVEIDIWSIDDQFFLGHDKPLYSIKESWILDKPLWLHAKNQEAIENLSTYKNITYFWHETDKITLTSKGILWLYPGNYSKYGITVWLGIPNKKIPKMFGVCTDYSDIWKLETSNVTCYKQ